MTVTDDLDARRLPSRIAACRFDAFESQRVFRSILDTISRPGSIEQIPESIWQRVPSVLAPLLVLADVETTIHVSDVDTFAWADALVAATGARPSVIEESDLICVSSEAVDRLAPILETARRGTALEPERGARVSIGVHDLRERGAGTRAGSQLVLRGPGIDGDRAVCVDGLTKEHVDTWRRANSAFPTGIDVWMTTNDGRIVGIPRSTRIELSATWPDQERN